MKRRVLPIVAVAAILSVGCSEQEPEFSPFPSEGLLPTAAPSTERECREVVAGHAGNSPDLEHIRAVTGDDVTDADRDRAYDASIVWTGIIAETYECAAEFGPQPGGDTVFAQHAAALWLGRLALDDTGIDAVINTAMVGLRDFYGDSCFADATDTWFSHNRVDLDQMAACG